METVFPFYAYLPNNEIIHATYYPSKNSNRILVYGYGLTKTFHQYHPGLIMFAERLRQEHGISVVTFDYRGACVNNPQSFSETTLNMRAEDFQSVVMTVRDRFPGHFLVIGGHSAGGTLAAKLSGQLHLQEMVDAVLLATPAAYPSDAWGEVFGEEPNRPFSRAIKKRKDGWREACEFKAFADFPKPKAVVVCKKDDVVSDEITNRYIEESAGVYSRMLRTRPQGHKVFGCFQEHSNRIHNFAKLHSEVVDDMEKEATITS